VDNILKCHILSFVAHRQILECLIDLKITVSDISKCHLNFSLDIVVPETKSIKMMLEEEVKGIVVGDKVRECLINEESEHYSIFNEEERKEFVFRVFEHLVLGGAMCQYEDKITEYYEQTKQLYKSLVR